MSAISHRDLPDVALALLQRIGQDRGTQQTNLPHEIGPNIRGDNALHLACYWGNLKVRLSAPFSLELLSLLMGPCRYLLMTLILGIPSLTAGQNHHQAFYKLKADGTQSDGRHAAACSCVLDTGQAGALRACAGASYPSRLHH